MTLTEFLLARIAEDEAAARTATPGPWVNRERLSKWADASVESDDGETVAAFTTVYPECAIELESGDADHIARHDPARVLAECKAKRRIVGLHGYEWMGPDDAAEQGCLCDYEPWPCPTLRLLALPYADHPDYQPEWRP